MGKVIGLTGRIESGKSTVAGILIDCGFAEVAFADPVKDALAAMFGETRFHYQDRDLKEAVVDGTGMTRREWMIALGHDWGRNVVPGGIWIKIAEKFIQTAIQNGVDVVVSDVRYEDEAAMVRKYGVVCHVDRPGIERRDHQSEAGIEFMPGDVAILNDGTFGELQEKVAVVLADLMVVA